MKKHLTVLRLVCFLLASLMMLAILAGCQNDGDKEATDPADKGTQATQVATDKDGYVLDPIHFTLDREMSILISEQLKTQITADERGEDVINNALYDRWQTVEERLNIEINLNTKDGLWNANRTAFFQQVKSTSDSGDAYDALCVYNLYPGAMASMGYLENLTTGKYLDLTAPWWPQVYVDQLLLEDTLYGAVENSAKGTLRNLHGVFFNNDLLEENKLKSPYDYVEENIWTFDNMMALIKDTYQDLNADGKKDAKDFFGILTGTEAKIETWYFSMGYRYTEKDVNGEPQLVINSNAGEFIDRIVEASSTNDFYLVDTSHGLAFKEERAILYQTSIQLIESNAKNWEINYGVVPVPKGSLDQEKYISNVANTHDAWCVPLNAQSLDDSTAMIEVMASQSYRQIAPVYFETCIKLRYAPDERLADMYDLIRDSITFDFCQIYSLAFDSGKDPRSLVTACVKNPSGLNWASQWASNGAPVEAGFDKILEIYGLA